MLSSLIKFSADVTGEVRNEQFPGTTRSDFLGTLSKGRPCDMARCKATTTEQRWETRGARRGTPHPTGKQRCCRESCGLVVRVVLQRSGPKGRRCPGVFRTPGQGYGCQITSAFSRGGACSSRGTEKRGRRLGTASLA